MKGSLFLAAGGSNPDLANRIAKYLGCPLGTVRIQRFSDGELYAEIQESVRGRDCFIIQSTCPPVNDNIIELLILVDAIKRASAERITVVVPYYGYARQDRKTARSGITARLVADCIVSAGAHRALLLDLHAGQIQGFFSIPVDELVGMPVFLEYLSPLVVESSIVVSPDAGGVKRARAYAKKLNAPLAIIDKRRPGPNKVEVEQLIGDVSGKKAIIIDDMVDTASTLIQAAKCLVGNGAQSVMACATHGVLSGLAISRLAESPIDKLVVTDSIPLSDEAASCGKISVLSVASLLGEAVKRISNDASISALRD